MTSGNAQAAISYRLRAYTLSSMLLVGKRRMDLSLTSRLRATRSCSTRCSTCDCATCGSTTACASLFVRVALSYRCTAGLVTQT